MENRAFARGLLVPRLLQVHRRVSLNVRLCSCPCPQLFVPVLQPVRRRQHTYTRFSSEQIPRVPKLARLQPELKKSRCGTVHQVQPDSTPIALVQAEVPTEKISRIH